MPDMLCPPPPRAVSLPLMLCHFRLPAITDDADEIFAFADAAIRHTPPRLRRLSFFGFLRLRRFSPPLSADDACLMPMPLMLRHAFHFAEIRRRDYLRLLFSPSPPPCLHYLRLITPLLAITPL